MKHLPLISIVTPSLNQARFIGEALASVQLQNYDNHEHLIIDGMSTDGTLDILRSYTADEQGKNMLWISELDGGQSEALNKGFRRAKGEIIGWLNSDDRYRPNCFESVVKAFEDNPNIDIVYGDYRVVNEVGETLTIRREIAFSGFVLMYHHALYIPTTATFFRRRVFEENNWLDEGLQYAMDLDFFIRLSERGYRFMHVPRILADFRLQPGSKTCSSSNKQKSEHQQVVFAIAPLVRNLKSPRLKTTTLFLLRSIAHVRRYSEKLFRGYYWEQLRSKWP
jgi:glycosyltransferase involved in cell wall biosynthesis